MAKFQASKSKRFSEAWYKEIEPILKKEFAYKNLPTRFEISNSAPSFVITNPEDENQMRQIREYFEKRTKMNQQLMETIVNNQLLVTEKLMEQLCISDMDKRKIQELEAELEQAKRSNSDFSVKNDVLNQEIVNLIARIESSGKASHEGTPKFNSERRHQPKLFDSNVAALCKRFNDNGKATVYSPSGVVRGQQLIMSSNNNSCELTRLNETETPSDLETSMVCLSAELETDKAPSDRISPTSTTIAKYYGDRRAHAVGEKKTVTELARTFQNSPSRRSKNGSASRAFNGGGGRYQNGRRIPNN